MAYLLVVLILATVAYVAWRMAGTRRNQTSKRVIGPDDDPEFLWRLNHPDNNPR